MKRRLPTPEELALWDHVTRADKRLARATPRPAEAPPKPLPEIEAPPPVAPLPRFRVGEKVDHRGGHDLLPGLAESMGTAAPRMDAKAFGRLKKGKLRPEARIDLHGMTQAEAHPELVHFLLSAHAAGLRLVLVITGKGRLRDDVAPMPAREGILRHQVPRWIALPPLSHVVLQVAPAHLTHGGTGALYVYLRRR